MVLAPAYPGGVPVALDFPETTSVHSRQPLDGLSAAWLEGLSAAGRAPGTIRAYWGDIARFQNWAQAHGLRNWMEIDNHAAARFVTAEIARGVGLRLVARRVGAVKAVFRYAKTKGYRLPKITTRTKQPSRGAPAASVFDVNRTIRACRGTGYFAVRDRAILEVLCGTGITLEECCDLDIDSVDLNFAALVAQSRRFGRRRLPLVPSVVDALLDWFRMRRAVDSGAADILALFTSAQGFRIKPGSLAEIVQRRSIAAGVVPPLSPRTLRTSFGVHLIETGADDGQIAVLMGLSPTRIADLRRIADPRRRRESPTFREIVSRARVERDSMHPPAS